MLRVNGYAVDRILYNGAEITDRTQRLHSCEINRENGRINYTVEGDENNHSILFEEGENSVTYTWPDGFTCEVSIG